MQAILRFLRQNSPFFAWLLFAVGSLVLLLQGNPYHRSVWFGSANRLVGGVYAAVGDVTAYFGLRATNEELLARTGELETENLRLRQLLQHYHDVEALELDTMTQYTYTIAHVVGNSIHQADNYITLDRGTAHGVHPDMGVANQSGVVGIVVRASEHYALVLSVLSSKMKLSAIIRDSESSGSLEWDGRDAGHALLHNLPRSVQCAPGDTVVTSGFSAAFPKGVPVGQVESILDDGSTFMTLQVRLFTDFSRLSDVHVIDDSGLTEQLQLEAPVRP